MLEHCCKNDFERTDTTLMISKRPGRNTENPDRNVDENVVKPVIIMKTM